MWPHLTSENIHANLRGPITKDKFPASLLKIYHAIATCHDATNQALFSGQKRPAMPSPDVKYMILWPDETPGDVGTSPLDNLCHWSPPVVELRGGDGRGDPQTCAKDYGAGTPRAYNFRAGRQESEYCGSQPCCPIAETRKTKRTRFCSTYSSHMTCRVHKLIR